MKIDLKDKIALVTGATRGIGKDIAEEFGRCGAELISTGTRQDLVDSLNKNKKKMDKRTYHCVDFTKKESLERFLKALQAYQRIDICVNNAGINRLNYVDETKTEDWEDMVNVNLRAPYMLIRHLSKLMKKNKYGRIINISSIFGVVSKERRSIYTTTKFGLHGMTVTAALELAPHHILVNTVSPGFIQTDMTEKNLSKEEREQLAKEIPVKRLGMPQDIASVVAFLASSLNTYITGQNIVVDGGFTCA